MSDGRILAPKALLLNAESNERDPHTSMKIMGEKLAKEVHRCDRSMPEAGTMQRQQVRGDSLGRHNGPSFLP